MSRRGWRRSPGNRTIALVALTALVALVAGLLVGRTVTSPAEAAAEAAPPAAGPITVPVEQRVISNDVTLRGDAQYDDPQPLTVETGDRGEVGGPAVVTGQVPQAGDTLEAGGVALEVTGRPVLVLPGELPVYRTLRVGVSGPDVTQLKQALASLDVGAGDLESDSYDADTAAGVVELFARAGYAPPPPPEGSAELAQEAERAVEQADADLAAARAALAAAQGGPTRAARLEADNLVREQERQLGAARATGDPLAVAAAQDALALSRAQRDEALAVPPTTDQEAAVDAARDQRESARAALALAREETTTTLPAGEVVYLPSLPRRVDEVSVQRGSTVEGPVMQVSGATLEIVASAASSDADLLEVDMPAVFEVPDGGEVAAVVAAVEAGGATEPEAPAEGDVDEGLEEPAAPADAPAATGRSTVTFAPAALTEEQLTALQGQNVRVSVPVGSTDGEVLAVPLAALTAGPGGESRVEVGDGGETRLVTVSTGLAADGYVEITQGDVAAGDLVVVGR